MVDEAEHLFMCFSAIYISSYILDIKLFLDITANIFSHPV
jgi:hypothetical protein